MSQTCPLDSIDYEFQCYQKEKDIKYADQSFFAISEHISTFFIAHLKHDFVNSFVVLKEYHIDHNSPF